MIFTHKEIIIKMGLSFGGMIEAHVYNLKLIAHGQGHRRGSYEKMSELEQLTWKDNMYLKLIGKEGEVIQFEQNPLASKACRQ